MPSPGPVGEQDADEILHGIPGPSRVSHVKKVKVPEKRIRSTKARSKTKRKEKATEAGWEHTVVRKGGLEFMSNQTEEEAGQRAHGRRRGPLEQEAAEKARRIRKLRACWQCWVLKVPCSEGEICERCRKHFSPTADQLCCRSGFKDYEEIFFPDFLIEHLKKRKVEDLITEHTSGFSDAVLEIEVTTGSSFKPMRMTANVFRPTTVELLGHHHLTTEAEEQESQLILRYSAPVGLLALSSSELKRICKEHIETMITNAEYPEQATAGDKTKIPCRILEVVRQYCASKDLLLVRKTMMLHAINYFMSRIVTFSEESAMRVCESVQPWGVPRTPFLSSRLLNRQIKYVMHKLHREIVKEVLEGLEKSMRSRTKDSWGPSFCAILVLCLCMEDLQTVADTFVVSDIEKEGLKGLVSEFTRDQSFKACLSVDEYPFQQCTKLFHEIYRSHKQANTGVSDGAFNPIQSGAGIDAKAGWDKPTDDMVLSIRHIIWASYPELLSLSNHPAFVNPGYTAHPLDISINNTGRLASKFLTSFF